MKWYNKQPTIEEIHLIAWHHMVSDATLSTYTFENGVEQRKFVNPELAYQRIMLGMTKTITSFRDQMQTEVLPAIEGLGAAFTSFAEGLKQPLLPNEDGVK